MQSETIKTGKCPVCGSNEVYDNRRTSPANHRKFIIVSATKSFNVDTYVCANCGYFKEFIRDDDMKNEKLMNKVKEKWNKTLGGKIR
jgi:ribosomal protein L37E